MIEDILRISNDVNGWVHFEKKKTSDFTHFYLSKTQFCLLELRNFVIHLFKISLEESFEIVQQELND